MADHSPVSDPTLQSLAGWAGGLIVTAFAALWGWIRWQFARTERQVEKQSGDQKEALKSHIVRKDAENGQMWSAINANSDRISDLRERTATRDDVNALFAHVSDGFNRLHEKLDRLGQRRD